MKKYLILVIQSVFIFTMFCFVNVASAQSKKDTALFKDCKEARAEFIKTEVLMQHLFDNAVGYVIFPNIGKGAVGVGGASGNGIVYSKGKVIGKAKVTQISVGFQFGGQAYREVILKTKKHLNASKKIRLNFLHRLLLLLQPQVLPQTQNIQVVL